MLIRTSLNNFSLQPFEIVWISGAKWKDGRSDASAKKALCKGHKSGVPYMGKHICSFCPPVSGPQPS